MATDDEIAPEADRAEGYPHPREALALHGQEAAERRFLDAWTAGRLHHAWLLRGPRGVGKATLAYRIARALLAQPPAGGLLGGPAPVPETLAPPPDCPVRARILARAEPRLFVLRREWDADRKRVQTQIAVDNVRAMRHVLQMSVPDGGWRVVIVDPADEMNRSSANALLKYLEEPPADVLFLLVSHAPAGLLPTIRSRCRTLDLAPLGADALASALAAAGAEVPPGDAAALTEISRGSAGEALRVLGGDGLALYRRIVGMIAPDGVSRPEATGLADACAGRQAAERYRLTIALTLLLMARLARAAATGETPPEAAPGEAALIARTARHPAQARLWAEALGDLSARTRHAVAVNLDPAGVVLDMLLELDATLTSARAVAA